VNPVKPLLEWALLRTDPAWRARSRIRGRALILAYHNIVPNESDGWADPALHLPQSRFAQQLDLLCRTCEVVPLQDILAGRRTDGRPMVAITFDDAYRGAVRLAGPLLAERKLPATFFVAPGRLGGQSFWWDSIRQRNGEPLDSESREHILEFLEGKEEKARDWARAHGTVGQVPAVGCTASETDLLALASVRGMELGSHSWSHPNLAALTGEELAHELTSPAEWIAERTGKPPAAIAYPYGRSAPETHEAAGGAGYAAGLAIAGGWLGAESPMCLPRLSIPRGLSLRGLALRLKGLLAGAPFS
jgi:peptidoglycan/xylan/chitin deacetylase (PgdA/CDA1 family)